MADLGNEIIAQARSIDFISAIPTIIVAILTFIAGQLVNRQGRNQFFSTVVSKERMEWIKEMRKACVDLCTICEMHANESDLSSEEKKTFYETKNSMMLHLNNTKEPERKQEYPIDYALYNLLNGKSYKAIHDNINDIREKATEIFKVEWDKVKIEAGNSRSKAKKIRKLQNSLSGKKVKKRLPLIFAKARQKGAKTQKK